MRVRQRIRRVLQDGYRCLLVNRLLSLIGALIVMLLMGALTIPPFALAAGNIFFNGNSVLYNANLAHFLFTRAAHPVVGIAPQYAHYQLSRVHFVTGELYEALDEAHEELIAYPDNTATYYILGLTYGYLGRTYEAIDAFSSYIGTHPGTWAARNDKAWLQFRAGDIDGALNTIEPIVDDFRYTPWVQNTYCALLISKERFSDAKVACTRAEEAIDKMTEADWGHAYPGNDPRVRALGLEAMRESVEHNFDTIRNEEMSRAL